MNLEQIKQDMMMEEAIASAELAGANLEDIDKLSDKEASELDHDTWAARGKM